MARLEVRFVDGSDVWLDHEVSRLGRDHVTASGLIEAKDVNGAKVWINREHIAYVREHASAATAPELRLEGASRREG